MKAVIIVMIGLMLLAVGCTTQEQTPDPAPFPVDEDYVPSTVQKTGNVYQVLMVDGYFLPSTLEISAGDTVEWINPGISEDLEDELEEEFAEDPDEDLEEEMQARHTVTFEDGQFEAMLPKGATVSHTFTESGVYNYLSQFHPDAQGIVIVS